MNKDNDIQDILDLLDLCQLNLMEENVSQTIPQFEQDHALEAIDLKRKQLSNKIAEKGLSFSEEQIKKHRETFTTKEGKYPPEMKDLFPEEEEIKE